VNAQNPQKRTSDLAGVVTNAPLSSETISDTESEESKEKSLLGNKTKRSEASHNTPRSVKYQEIISNPQSELNRIDLKSEIDSDSCFKTGRWSDAEHEVLIEALIKHGKDWKKVKKHIKTRGYFQIVQYTTRFLNRIRKLLNINFTLSYYSMNNFKKLIKQQKIKKHFNRYPQFDLDSKNYEKAKPKEQKIFLEILFFEIISIR